MQPAHSIYNLFISDLSNSLNVTFKLQLYIHIYHAFVFIL